LASELRLILAAICVPLLIAIWWWGSRRSRQAPGNAELRESTMTNVGTPAAAARNPAATGETLGRAETRDWGVPPLGPLNIRTAEFEPVDVEPLPMTPHADPLEETFDLGAAEREFAASRFASAPAADVPPAVTAPLPASAAPMNCVASPVAAPRSAPFAASAEPAASAAAPALGSAAAPMPADAAATGSHEEFSNASQTQRIITIRVGAIGDARWSGGVLLTALEDHGMAFGRYQVFHRRHSDGRTLFCAANVVEPGTFDLAHMPKQEFRGVTLFAILPGPIEPLQTLNELILTAGQLAQTLGGIVQDSRGHPLTQKQAEAIREDVAQFQAAMSVS
jgi:FtsZ-interacting cell division protein ZipA